MNHARLRSTICIGKGTPKLAGALTSSPSHSAPPTHGRGAESTDAMYVARSGTGASVFSADGRTFGDGEKVDPVVVVGSFAAEPLYSLIKGNATTARLVCHQHPAGKVLRTFSNFVAPRNRA